MFSLQCQAFLSLTLGFCIALFAIPIYPFSSFFISLGVYLIFVGLLVLIYWKSRRHFLFAAADVPLLPETDLLTHVEKSDTPQTALLARPVSTYSRSAPPTPARRTHQFRSAPTSPQRRAYINSDKPPLEGPTAMYAPDACRWYSLIGLGALGIMYVGFTYTILGLVLWEVAAVWTFYLLLVLVVFLVLYTMWIIRNVWKHEESVCLPMNVTFGEKTCKYYSCSKTMAVPWGLLIVLLTAFIIWGMWPAFSANTYGSCFKSDMERALGTGYVWRIPQSIRQTWTNTDDESPFSFVKMIAPKAIDGTSNIVYGISYGNLTRQYYDAYFPKHPHFLNSSNADGKLLTVALIEVHGGATRSESGREKVEVNTAKYFTNQGMTVFSIEYRNVPSGAHIWDMANDVSDALQHIIDHADDYQISTQHIYVLGRSRGGGLLSVVLARNQTFASLIRGFINLYGLTDPYYCAEEGNSYCERRLNKDVFGVTCDKNESLCQNFSATFLLNSTSPTPFPSTLFLQGNVDGLVYPRQAIRLSQRLDALGVQPNILLQYPLGQHGFDALPNTPGGQLGRYFIERYIWGLTYTE